MMIVAGLKEGSHKIWGRYRSCKARAGSFFNYKLILRILNALKINLPVILYRWWNDCSKRILHQIVFGNLSRNMEHHRGPYIPHVAPYRKYHI